MGERENRIPGGKESPISKSSCRRVTVVPGVCWARDYSIGSNFIKTGFTLVEPVSLVKVFRLFRLERIFLGVQSVDRVGQPRLDSPY